MVVQRMGWRAFKVGFCSYFSVPFQSYVMVNNLIKKKKKGKKPASFKNQHKLERLIKTFFRKMAASP